MEKWYNNLRTFKKKKKNWANFFFENISEKLKKLRIDEQFRFWLAFQFNILSKRMKLKLLPYSGFKE